MVRLCLWLGGQSPQTADSFSLEFLPKYFIENIWLILRPFTVTHRNYINVSPTVGVIKKKICWFSSISNYFYFMSTIFPTDGLMIITRIETVWEMFWFSSTKDFKFIFAITSEIIWPKVVFLPFSGLSWFGVKTRFHCCFISRPLGKGSFRKWTFF